MKLSNDVCRCVAVIFDAEMLFAPAEITKRIVPLCDIRNNCARYTDRGTSEHQSYMMGKPNCQDFISNEGE